MENSDATRRENAKSYRHSRCGPSFETRAMRAPQDEVVACGAISNPHGEEARSAVSNHEAPLSPRRPCERTDP
jgi:hypothetical protein